ncbi:MAG: hypothetical protein NC489_05430, partial [Ruminococcus flavefaciens]|nr:hypothetical protein [Ruminococcus flavefaciens]
MKHTKYLSGTENRNNGFFLLCIAEVIGIIIGSCAVFSDMDMSFLRQNLCPELNGATLTEIFRNTLVSSLIFVVTAFFCGLSAFGQPLGIALIVLKGAEIGLSVGFVYAEKGLSALPAVLVLNVPEEVALSVVAVLA